MSLVPGMRIGGYDVIALVGKGGMGEVYRARDTRLQRDVAIKILPELFARDPERLARFEREARTLAALNHPNVAHVYGLVELPSDAGGHGLVMEFVDGEDLSQRIARTGAIALDDALPIARQICEAVEAAHEQGIIHRDLKPANVKLRGDGQVKVLDFGLAKALAPADHAAAAPNIDNSPTITSPFQLSQLGVILGTAAYMAPEQAKGRPIDKRADIWAFGCVLYEMLTGTRPFAGEDVTDTLAAIVRADPDWSALPVDTPSNIRTLLRRCLEKDRRERLPDIGAARLELKEPPQGPEPRAAVPSRPTARARPWIVLTLLSSLAAMAAIVYAVKARPSDDTRVYRSVIMPPAPLLGPPVLRLQISADGRRIALIAPDPSTGVPMLWIRPIDGMTAQAIAGTEDAQGPFWSPDSKWVAFYADGKLKKVDLASGALITLCDVTVSPPGTWNRDGVILFTRNSVIVRIPAGGGAPQEVTRLRPGEQTHISPWFLPDGKHFLYTVSAAGARQPGVFVASLDSQDATKILDVPSNASYANGHVLYLREATLLAQRFDPDSRQLTGAPIPLAEGLQVNPTTGTGAYSVSNTGVLIYQTGNFAGTQLTWLDRSGKGIGTLGEHRPYSDVQLSPDGLTASAAIGGSSSQDVWLFDVERKLPRRFTFDQLTGAAVWSPDSRSLVYGTRRGSQTGSRDLYRRPAGGGGTEEALLHDQIDKIPLGFSPDGHTLVYRTATSAAAGDLWLLALDGDRRRRGLPSLGRMVSAASVSPDGRWLAYAAVENGRRDVFVSSFPDGTGKWQISPGGGDNPVWRADGKELFFHTNNKMMAVDVMSGDGTFVAGPPRQLFPVWVPSATLGTRSTYAVSRDGQRFLVNMWDPGTVVAPIALVVNWPAAIK